MSQCGLNVALEESELEILTNFFYLLAVDQSKTSLFNFGRFPYEQVVESFVGY